MEKKYTVFVSSTYEDLKEERQEVMQALLEMDCIPCGMELFPAASEEQFEFIKSMIDNCDYYVLILAGRYGSMNSSGISYTELEFRYALEKNIPVISFVHGDIGSIPSSKCDCNYEEVEKLHKFQSFVKGRLCRFWTNKEQLSGLVSRSMIHLINKHPAIGWTRNNFVHSETTIENNLTKVKKENNDEIEGNRFLEMALTIDLNNSLRNTLFEESLKKHNIHAGAYLGSIYLHGIENRFEKDYKKAFEIFKSLEDYDDTGLISWFLGWMFENGYVGKIKDEPDFNCAYQYYEKSKQLGFVKAYNSIGKFYNFGKWVKVDTIKAINNYSQGAEMGDINAMLNLAFLLEEDMNKLDDAEKWFSLASDNGSHFANLRLGRLYMDNISHFNIKPQEIANLYIKSINSGDLSEDKIACGYFWLSQLLIIDSNIDIKALSCEDIKDRYQYCVLKAYTILFNLNEQGKHIGAVPYKIWNKLSESIRFNV